MKTTVLGALAAPNKKFITYVVLRSILVTAILVCTTITGYSVNEIVQSFFIVNIFI